MARRTQLFSRIPWTGGVNTSVDAGVLPSNDLVQADNVVFSTSGSRNKREGFSYFDTAVPAVASRSSSGTTRTLIFASSVNIASPADAILVVGERIKVVSAGNSNYNTTDGVIATITTTNTTNDTITYTFSGASALTEGATADTAATVTRARPYIGVLDVWYYSTGNQVKEQTAVAVNDYGLMFRFDTSGRRTQIVKSGSGATSLVTTPLTTVDMRMYNNKLIIAMSGVGNTPKYFDPNSTNEWKDLPNAPDGQYLQEHLGRLWMDNKLDIDRLYFSETFDETVWSGVGDSGAIYIGSGDGDTRAISAIFPPFRGRLIVGKGNKVYQITGEAPEEFFISELAGGQGVAGHKSVVPVELDDLYYFSGKGIHSINTTQQFGDFTSRFLSARIQRTFNDWPPGNLKFSQGIYLPAINSVMWTVTEDGASAGTSLWLFNPTIPNEDGSQGVWFRWPDLYPQSICVRRQSGYDRPLCGVTGGRLIIGLNGLYSDMSVSSTFRVKTGAIYVDNNPQTVKMFKKLTMLFKPRGSYNFTVYFKVDNMPPQALSFSQRVQGATLGTTLTLGTSTIGNEAVLAPYTADIYGHGRGCSIEVFQTGLESQVEIYGFIIEYESADVSDEVTDS